MILKLVLFLGDKNVIFCRRITDFADFFLSAQSNTVDVKNGGSAQTAANVVDLGDLAQILAGGNNLDGKNNGISSPIFGEDNKEKQVEFFCFSFF